MASCAELNQGKPHKLRFSLIISLQMQKYLTDAKSAYRCILNLANEVAC